LDGAANLAVNSPDPDFRSYGNVCRPSFGRQFLQPVPGFLSEIRNNVCSADVCAIGRCDYRRDRVQDMNAGLVFRRQTSRAFKSAQRWREKIDGA
jgi:hypothetical protein